MKPILSRRAFLSVSVSVPLLIPGTVLGLGRSVSPSNRITLGFCGVGCMNQGHLRHTLSFPDVQVLAVSDPDHWRRNTKRDLVNHEYAKQKERDYKGCDAYSGFHEMLPRTDIDGFVIATGEQWHGPAVIMAAKAGKDVYVEKPSAITIHEALASIEAVRRHGTICQVGYQQRSWENFQFACKLVRDGVLGNIDRIYIVGLGASAEIDLPAEPTPPTLDWDVWLGPSPERPFNHRLHYLGNPLNVVPWHFCRNLGLGNLGASGSHAFDVVHWGLNLDESGPQEIHPADDKIPYLTFKYPNDVTLHVCRGRLEAKYTEIPKGFDPITSVQAFGAVFVGENGWIHVGRQGYLKSYPAAIAKDRPSRFEGHNSHVRNWLDCMRLRKRPMCDIAVGSHSTIAAVLGNIACWLNRPLKWDSVKHEFLNDEEANRLRARSLRQPWVI